MHFKMRLNIFYTVVLSLVCYISLEIMYFTLFNNEVRTNNILELVKDLQSIVLSKEEFLRGPLPQNDERILKQVREILHAPRNLPYNLTNGDIDPSKGQSTIVQQVLQNMENGFFVECGALDGETRSNSLIFEKKYKWKGILIEADPNNFKQVIEKQRQAWTINVCLAIQPYPHRVKFYQAFNVGKISKTGLEIQCFPFFSILSALNVNTVDYFSLDVEGFELQVLKTIPFDLILIKVLSVEYIHDVEGEGEILKFMKSQGYVNVSRVTNRNGQANDIIFVHKSVKIPPNVTKLIST